MHTILDNLIATANQIILGKDKQIRLAICCVLSRGHLLIEDTPGVGKTTLAHCLAKLLDMQYQRIQFTSDLLPADIIGSNIFDTDNHQFKFHPGPIFNQMILADEINRSTPKAQSALLEAMEEHQVTSEGATFKLPAPFFVIATQNPSHLIGTFPLPESQLDRFLMRIELGYPDTQSERALLTGTSRNVLIENASAILSSEHLQGIQNAITKIHVSEALLDYLQALLCYSRESQDFQYGLSPRAGLALLTAAKAWAFMHQFDAVLPEHIQAVLAPVAGHRLKPGSINSEAIVAPLLQHVAIP